MSLVYFKFFHSQDDGIRWRYVSMFLYFGVSKISIFTMHTQLNRQDFQI